MPMNRPLIPKMITVSNMIRISSTVSAWVSGAASGTNRWRAIGPARTNASPASSAAAATSSVITPPARRSAPSSSPSARKRVNTGMNAEPSAPPATSTNNVSGTRWAAMNASSSTSAPNAALIADWRTMPSTPLAM